MPTVANLRATTGMFGAGYLDAGAREMTAELQRIRDSSGRARIEGAGLEGDHFGTSTLEGRRSLGRQQGEGHLRRLSLLHAPGRHNPPTLVIRPWHQASNVVSLREFRNTAFNHHHGIQSTERFGVDTDPDGDGFVNELTRADVTAVRSGRPRCRCRAA